MYPCQNIAMVTSIYLTVIIALERYLAVSQPLSVFIADTEGQRWTKVMYFVLPPTMFSILFNLPTFFEFKSEDFEEWDQQEILGERYNNFKLYRVKLQISVNEGFTMCFGKVVYLTFLDLYFFFLWKRDLCTFFL